MGDGRAMRAVETTHSRLAECRGRVEFRPRLAPLARPACLARLASKNLGGCHCSFFSLPPAWRTAQADQIRLLTAFFELRLH